MPSVTITAAVTDSLGASSIATATATQASSFIWQAETDVVDTVTINGNPYVPEMDTSKTWPQKFATNVDKSTGALGDLWQFEIHSGDVSNIGSERDELDGYRNTIPRNTEFWISYAVKVLPGTVIPFSTTLYNILGQCHAGTGATSANPDFYCWYLDDKFYFNVHAGAPLANVDGQGDGTFYVSPVLPRDVWHNVVFDVIKSSSGVGDKMVAWFDGVQIYNQVNKNLFGDHAAGSYWKFGWYRAQGGGGPLPTAICQFANVEVSTSSLLSRVASPLAFPTPL